DAAGREASDGELWFYEAHNSIRFYTWGNRECWLPRGATAATLLGTKPGAVLAPPGPAAGDQPAPAPAPRPAAAADPPRRPPSPVLHLSEGDLLIFEEVISPTTGAPADADSARRHVVRL